jgi:mannosyl-oligosaccharide glucosidase
MAAQALSAGLQASSTLYSSRFDTTFQLASKGFPPAQVEFAKALTSNMMGGLGYFYGPSIVDRYFRHEYDEEDEEDEDDEDDSPVMGGIGGAASSSKGGKRQPRPETTEPKELFTATPSRSFFPRGFYW